MSIKDKLFIFVTIVLIGLFAARVISNIPRQGLEGKALPWQDERVLTTLEEAGLRPQEAKYYRVIDE